MLEEMTILNRILCSLLLHGMVTRTSLLILNESKGPVYQEISKALNKKMIKQRIVKTKIKGNYVQVAYYTITRKGIQRIKDGMEAKMPWLSYINTNVERIIIRGHGVKAARVERFVRISSVAMMMRGIGADTETTYINSAPSEAEQVESDRWWETDYDLLSDEENETSILVDTMDEGRVMPLSELVLTAINKYQLYQGQNNNGMKETNYNMTFHNAIQIKTKLTGGRSDLQASDFTFGRYSGLLESRYKSVLLYIQTSIGVVWSKKVAEREMAAMKNYGRFYTINKNIKYDDVRAGIFISNPKSLSDIFFGSKGRNDKEGVDNANAISGKPFTHFYVIPITYEALKLFKYNMETSDCELQKFIINKSVDGGLCVLGETLDNVLFPLTNESGANIAIGTIMDLNQMRILDGIMSRFREHKFGLMCYGWQVEYYRRIYDEKIEYFVI